MEYFDFPVLPILHFWDRPTFEKATELLSWQLLADIGHSDMVLVFHDKECEALALTILAENDILVIG